MDLTIAYAKTDLAWSAIRTRNIALSAAKRAMLIMMDGKRPLADLMPAIEALSLSLSDVRELLAGGLVSPATPPSAAKARPAKDSAVASAPLAAAPVTPPATSRPGAAATPAAASRPAPSTAAGQRSLAAAKFYALDQIGRLLGRQDEDLRLAARHVVDHHSLLAWLDACRHVITEIAGEERAHLLVTRTHELMPEAQPAGG